VLIDAVFPPATIHHLDIVAIARATLPDDAIENILPIFELPDSAFQLLEFFWVHVNLLSVSRDRSHFLFSE
jgi:hypothetical protein